MNKLIAFAVGFFTGTIITKKVIESKFDERMKAEIDEQKRYYELQLKRAKEVSMAKDIPTKPEPKKEEREVKVHKVSENDAKLNMKYDPNRVEYNKAVKTYKPESEANDEVYVIDPGEYGKIYDYSTETLIYYSNGTLTAADGEEVIDDYSIIGGKDILDSMGEDVPGRLYIRNDSKCVDYMIVEVADEYEED